MRESPAPAVCVGWEGWQGRSRGANSELVALSFLWFAFAFARGVMPAPVDPPLSQTKTHIPFTSTAAAAATAATAAGLSRSAHHLYVVGV